MWKKTKKWGKLGGVILRAKGTFLVGFGFNKKLACKLEIAVRPIEPLANLKCKSQLLLKGSIYLLDRETHLLDKRYIYWIEISTSTTIPHNCWILANPLTTEYTFPFRVGSSSLFVKHIIFIWLKQCLTQFFQ